MSQIRQTTQFAALRRRQRGRTGGAFGDAGPGFREGTLALVQGREVWRRRPRRWTAGLIRGYLLASARRTIAVAAWMYLLWPRSPIVLMLNAFFRASASPSLIPAMAATGALSRPLRSVFSYCLSRSLSRS